MRPQTFTTRKTSRIDAILCAVVACPLLTNAAAYAQTPISYSAVGTTYSENFNAPARTYVSDTTQGNISNIGIPNIAAVNANGNVTTYRSDTGATSVTSTSNLGGIFAYHTAGSQDYAFGAINTNGSGDIFYGLVLVNDTDRVLDEITLGYRGEQWRQNGTSTAQSILFDYKVGASGLTDTDYTGVPALRFNSPIFSGAARALDGNLAANSASVSTSLTGLNWGQGQTLWLRWSDNNASNNDHALAVDDVFVQTPEPGTFALALLGVGPLGVMAARRRKAADR